MTLRRLVRDALEAIYPGDQSLEADALLDQLADRGVRVVGPLPAVKNGRAV